ncbi:hypothetical protein GCM10022226_62090 [Sphaerisporangium flaviroseum]|uniref:Schlafen AlbA-2 domain-containing protein n=1 Tax=Sphaerisporangium flaviroseum TaxID=509199 RepID=A0ABP7J1D4_9ACTN
MPVLWSGIHAALGEPPGELTFAMVKAAVDQRITETEDLDWKGILPTKEEESLHEFAKDVAAMANTRGGLLVYGVEEERGKGRAKAIASVDISEGAQRRLRKLAVNRVHPRVVGLDTIPLASDDGSETVLALSVPRSPDAPHIIGQGEKLGIPYRHGPETEWMRERDLERAYSDRFAARADERTRLSTLLSETSDQLDLGRAAWIVGVAAPRTPLPTVAGPLPRAEVPRVLESVLSRTKEIAPSTSSHRYWLVREFDQAALNPRVGLRRWIVETNPTDDPDRRCDFVRVELHHDGSVVLAAALEGWYGSRVEGSNFVPTPVVESFAADFIALAETYARHLGSQNALAARVDLVRDDVAGWPFTAISDRLIQGHSTGQYRPPHGARTVRRFQPLATEIPSAAAVDTLRAVARGLAEDVLHQFGVANLAFL